MQRVSVPSGPTPPTPTASNTSFLSTRPSPPCPPGFYEGAVFTGEQAAETVGALLRQEKQR